MSSSTLFALAAMATVVGPGVLSTDRSDYNLTASAEGSIQVFARSDARFKGARILVVEAGAVAPISFSDPRFDDSDPQISPDGRSLVFVSTRPTPGRPEARDLNIWRATRDAGGWSAPEPIAGVDSPAAELGPEIHHGVLYFNSNRPGGRGGFDIWRATAGGRGFAEPHPMPAPINSSANEGDFTLSRDGRVALFWSDRPGGLGSGDIWMSVRKGRGWADAINLGPAVNGPGFDFAPTISADGRTLTFASTRPRDGVDRLADIYAIPISEIPVLRAALNRR